MTKLSLFIITLNEEPRLFACLKAAQPLADEIIIVDSGSRDKTKEIALSFGAKFFFRKFDNFAAQKQFALSKCSGKWVLSLDADEIINPELKSAISNIIAADKCSASGYELLRVNYFLGHCMRHSGLKNDFILRLALRKEARFSSSMVHEALFISEPPLRIKSGHLQHYSYSSIWNYFEKFNKYTMLGARDRLARNNNAPCLCLFLIRIPFDFIRRYIFQLGFLDGTAGFIWCMFSAFYPFVKYAKCWEILDNAGASQKA